MPTFDTPEPISVTIGLVVGDTRVTASERGDTTVQVRPSDESHEPDVRAAEQTRVEYSDGRLLVKTPKQRALGLFGKPGSIELTIELPAGSNVEVDSQVLEFRAAGRLGRCRVKTGAGGVELDQASALDLNTGAGSVIADRIGAHAEITTGSGRVRVRDVDGTAVIKNSNGDSWIGGIGGELRVEAANGTIVVDRANAGVTAKTANGDVRVGELTRGSASLKTGYGEVEIGIRAGSAARLDVNTRFGRVDNRMDTAEQPAPSDETVDVYASTGFGDIVIHRA